jgi:predicted alpha/beta superfamily hydrolase
MLACLALMRRMKTFVVALSASLAAVSASAQDLPRAISTGERLSMRSAVLGEERPYWVHLPDSYGDTRYAPRRYPVMYLLDGDSSFHFVTGTVHFMSEGLTGSIQVPELIVVAIPNTDRTRDLTPTHTIQRPEGDDLSLKNSGGGDAFLRFLKEELIPEIDRAYRTSPYRMIVGHSFGALFALHALLREPDLFHGYIAIDPSVFWDDEVLVRRAATGLQNGSTRPRTVHLSLSRSYEGGYTGDAAKKLAGHLKSAAGVRSTLQYFEQENHQSVPLLALYHGLLYVFEGYKLSPGQMFEQASNLGAHFEGVSARIGVPVVPPERFVDQVAHAFLNAGEIDKAIGLFTFNAERNPTSLNAYNSLGQAYTAKHRGPKP